MKAENKGDSELDLFNAVEALDGADLFEIGLENPCSFWSREMYESTNGYPPSTVCIDDVRKFAVECIKERAEPVDYVGNHLEDLGVEALPFHLECGCPSCSEEDPCIGESDD